MCVKDVCFTKVWLEHWLGDDSREKTIIRRKRNSTEFFSKLFVLFCEHWRYKELKVAWGHNLSLMATRIFLLTFMKIHQGSLCDVPTYLPTAARKKNSGPDSKNAGLASRPRARSKFRAVIRCRYQRRQSIHIHP